MPQKLLAIIGNTFIETIRQPIYAILMWAAAGWIALTPSVAAFSLEGGGDNKILKDIGLSTLLLFGLLASVFCAAGVISREIESRSVLTVVSKPVSRPLFLVGKFAGLTAAMLLGFYFLSLVFLMAARHGVMESTSDKYDLPVIVLGTSAVLVSLVVATFGNYVYGWHFAATLQAWCVTLGTIALGVTMCFNRQWAPQEFVKDFGNLQLVYALISIFCAVVVLIALAVTVSTRFTEVTTLMICAAIFMAGLLVDYLTGPESQRPLHFQVLAALLPNFQFFWLGDAITQAVDIPASHVAYVAGYAALYSLGVLSLGVALFQTREVG